MRSLTLWYLAGGKFLAYFPVALAPGDEFPPSFGGQR